MKNALLSFLFVIITNNCYSQLTVTPKNVKSSEYITDKLNGIQVIKDAIVDYKRVIVYYDSNNILKTFEEIAQSGVTLETVVPIYVTYEQYKNDMEDEFDIIKAEIKDYYKCISYIDAIGDIKIYKSPAISENYIWDYNWKTTWSAMIVPFKSRPATNYSPSESKANINNLGIYISRQYNWEKWYFNDETDTFSLGFGIFLAPMVEELNNTNSSVDFKYKTVEKTNQFYLSGALAITLSYNKLTFALIPAGIDKGISPTSTKWYYDHKYWWGFGIGIDTKFFGL